MGMLKTPELALPSGIRRARTRDGMLTFDSRTIDNSGAFLIGELERLDQKLHMPLAAVTWSRDIALREDVSVADEFSSFTNSSFAAAGSGKNWFAKNTNAIAGIALDIGKTTSPLNLWSMQLSWTMPELESAMKIGRPIDTQKYEGMLLKHQMDIDEQVYIGDTDLSVEGLVNSSKVTTTMVASGGTGPLWINKNPFEILEDVDKLLRSTWEASAFAVCPSKLLLPPKQFAMLNSRVVSDAGNISILEYLKVNSLSNAINGVPLDIQPLKWLLGRGVGGTDRMVAYSQDQDRVRFPLVPLQRLPLEYRDLRQLTTYFGRLGVTEFVYPETVAYADGL